MLQIAERREGDVTEQQLPLLDVVVIVEVENLVLELRQLVIRELFLLGRAEHPVLNRGARRQIAQGRQHETMEAVIGEQTGDLGVEGPPRAAHQRAHGIGSGMIAHLPRRQGIGPGRAAQRAVGPLGERDLLQGFARPVDQQLIGLEPAFDLRQHRHELVHMLLETRAVRLGESFVRAAIDDLKPGGDQIRLEGSPVRPSSDRP